MLADLLRSAIASFVTLAAFCKHRCRLIDLDLVFHLNHLLSCSAETLQICNSGFYIVCPFSRRKNLSGVLSVVNAVKKGLTDSTERGGVASGKAKTL